MIDFGGMVADPLPFERPEKWRYPSGMEIRMAWPATVDHDPAEEWFRARIVEVLAR